MPVSVKSFFHESSHTFSYVVWEPESSLSLVIDSVLDYHGASGCTSTESADRILSFIRERGLTLVWILETHAHADHISAASYLKSKLGGEIGIGRGIQGVQQTFKHIYNLPPSFETNGEQFDRLFNDGDQFEVGQATVSVISTPGHTSDSVTYVIGEVAFIGDTLFMPDYGTARCDFPGGSADTLYESIQRIYALPEETILYLCHDYIPKGSERVLENCTTVAEQKTSNVHIHSEVDKVDFIQLREKRDAILTVPDLIIPSIQVNIRAGKLPSPEDNGMAYLKVPLNVFDQLD